MQEFSLHTISTILTTIFLLAVGALILLAIVLFFIDITQSKSAIRRNYPFIGRFRYLFEHLGEFFRQYFFAMDREELPFNRALRSWVYRAAKNVSTNVAFGSTRNVLTPGEPHFVNAPFPPLEQETSPEDTLTFGPYCREPYQTKSFFNISGMSYGALSKPAVTALSNGAAKAGCWINTGEGGISPYHLQSGADIVFQIGTAKYGVRDENGALDPQKLETLGAYPQVKMIEIKLSQRAKPGKGGILPAEKVTKEIAEIRGIREAHASISPNRHEDISNCSELLDSIEKIRSLTGKPVGFKTVMGDAGWLDDLFNEIMHRGIQFAPDFITVDSADGGTGAAPQPLMDFVGLPLKESLPWLVQKLKHYKLKDRIKVIASGKQITPAYVATSLATGADAVVSARGFMFALGCIQAMQCHKNTCPTGITTHNARLQKGLDPSDKANRVANYHAQIIHDVNMIAHSCGVQCASHLEPNHVRIVSSNGTSELLAQQMLSFESSLR